MIWGALKELKSALMGGVGEDNCVEGLFHLLSLGIEAGL